MATSLIVNVAEFFSKLGLADNGTYRVYDREVIELNKDVSVILLMANSDDFVAASEPTAALPPLNPALMHISKRYTSRSSLSMSSTGPLANLMFLLAVLAQWAVCGSDNGICWCYHSGFEWTSWSTYQPELYSIQAGLSATMATEIIRLSHQLRSAFTNAEVAVAKESLALVTTIQEKYVRLAKLDFGLPRRLWCSNSCPALCVGSQRLGMICSGLMMLSNGAAPTTKTLPSPST
jgi:hypothetical protein